LSKAFGQWGKRLAAIAATLIAVMLLSLAAPTHDAIIVDSSVQTSSPLSEIGKAFSVSEANAHRGSKAHNKKHRRYAQKLWIEDLLKDVVYLPFE